MAPSPFPIFAANEAGGDLEADRARVNAALGDLCDRHLPGLQPRVAEAIRYSVMGEGKRLRPVMLLAAYRAAGGPADATALAAAVEVVHTYSLVHDDLPCMDDDAIRRGRPSTHRVFGVEVATVAGVAMVPLAALCAMDGARLLALSARAVGSIVRELMRASGAGGMIGGQLRDLAGEGNLLSLRELEGVHRGKTGALIVASMRIGAIAAAASPETVRALAEYGAAIGLAFQIADDVLDATATSERLGKTAGRDAALRKSTYPALLGINGAAARAAALASGGCAALTNVGLLTPALEELAHISISRSS